MYTLGFMQGRLSPLVAGRIQAFPRDHWEQEFKLAHDQHWEVMEWTIDQDGFNENPVMTRLGRQRILELMEQYQIDIPSVTADFTMQQPFYKTQGAEYNILLQQLREFLESITQVGIQKIVIPLVDNGALANTEEERLLRKGLSTLDDLLGKYRQTIVFESDFPPTKLADFIASFPANLYGINYDAGNSASLSYDVHEEFAQYGKYIKNVHIKDRLKGGSTVPLGTGNTDFDGLFQELTRMGYAGNLIFQCARSQENNHVEVLNEYRDFITRLMTSWI